MASGDGVASAAYPYACDHGQSDFGGGLQMQPRWGGPHGGVTKECNGSSHHVEKPYSMHMHTRTHPRYADAII